MTWEHCNGLREKAQSPRRQVPRCAVFNAKINVNTATRGTHNAPASGSQTAAKKEPALATPYFRNAKRNDPRTHYCHSAVIARSVLPFFPPLTKNPNFFFIFLKPLILWSDFRINKSEIVAFCPCKRYPWREAHQLSAFVAARPAGPGAPDATVLDSFALWIKYRFLCFSTPCSWLSSD